MAGGDIAELLQIGSSLRFGVGPRRALFHLGRAAGWIGHAIEQHEAGEMQHRRGLYTGPLPS